MQSMDLITLNLAMRAKAKAAAFYLYDPLVSLIDIGFRIKESEGKRVTEEPTVRVHLRRKLRGNAFESFATRYPERVIDERRIGFPTDIIEANYRLQQQRLASSPTTYRTGVHNPLKGGISISNEWNYGYGTLGGIVTDRKTGSEMILSNWHVLAGSDNVREGLRIYQPGTGDGGWFNYTVARLSRHAMGIGIDAAVAELTGSRFGVNEQFKLGAVLGVEQPMPGTRVVKSGRASGVTEGLIDGVEGVKIIPYGWSYRTVKNIVHIAQTADKGEVSAPGDSGSWWLEKSTMKAVGLHFAGDNEPEYGLAIAMPPVLDALNVDIVL